VGLNETDFLLLSDERELEVLEELEERERGKVRETIVENKN
jgi:hypothetical protein